MRVGIYENRPKIFTGDGGEAAGFWPDLIAAIAAREGWQVRYVHGSWSECMARLAAGEIDLMPDVAFSEERVRTYAFARGVVYMSWSRVYARRDSGVGSILDLEGKDLAVLKGSINVEGPDGIKALLERFDISCGFVEPDSYLRVFDLVAAGEVDAGVVTKDFAHAHRRDFDLVPTPVVFAPARLHFALPKNAALTPALIEAVDRRIAEMQGDGGSVYHRSLERWFGITPESQPAFPGWAKVLLFGFGVAILLLGTSAVLRSRLGRSADRRRQAERVLREAEARYRGIFEGAAEGILVADLESRRFVIANPAICRLLGYTQDELRGMSVADLHPAEALEGVLAAFEAQARGGGSLASEIPCLRKDGSVFYADVNTAPVVLDGRRCNVGFFLDATERKRAEERVRHLNAVLRGIRNVKQLITQETDRDRLIQRVCDRLVEALGCGSAIVGLTDPTTGAVTAHAGTGGRYEALRDTIRRGALPACARRAIAEGDLVVMTSRDSTCSGCPGARREEANDVMVVALARDDYAYGFLLVSVDAGLGGDPEEHGLFREVAGDIAFALHGMEVEDERDASTSALADAEEQLNQAQRLEAIGRLAGGVAHDFNNLLMVIMGYCDSLRREHADSQDDLEALEQIHSCSERAAGLTRQLLAFSRKQTLQPEILDLNAVVGNVEKMLGRLIGEDVELATVLAPDLGTVEADPGQMEQVLMNLVVNARDAMPTGGKVTVETANVELDEDYAAEHMAVHPGPYVRMSVSDTGVGMTEEVRRQIFDPFFTTKERGRGTGLGLSTVYGIVKQSGGDIWVYSEQGRGTTFKIYLPRCDREPPVVDTAGDEAVRPATRASILLVEDDAGLRRLLSGMVKNMGHECTAAADGAEAVARVEEDGLRPDLLITDVVMPRMSGVELGERLRRARPGLKVLFMSGYTDNAIVHHGVLDAGVPFIQKPFSQDDLAAKLAEVLRGGTGTTRRYPDRPRE